MTKHELKIELTAQGVDSMKRLQGEHGIESLQSLVTEAIRVYKYLVKHSSEGWQICLVRSGETKELVLK